jgi:hypothetical protein
MELSFKITFLDKQSVNINPIPHPKDDISRESPILINLNRSKASRVNL